MLLLAATIAAAPVTSTASAHAKYLSFSDQLLNSVNAIRDAHELAPLRASRPLDEAAQQHSLEMERYGFFSHDSKSGEPFWVRIEHWYPRRHGYWAVGENILWNSPAVGPVTTLRLWMTSPEHRANILNPAWREIGISVVHSDAAPGTYGGGPTTLVTTDFGVRR